MACVTSAATAGRRPISIRWQAAARRSFEIAGVDQIVGQACGAAACNGAWPCASGHDGSTARIERNREGHIGVVAVRVCSETEAANAVAGIERTVATQAFRGDGGN